jgi:hypothetical protein
VIAIDRILISEDIFDEKFVCDLSACKGICCVEGDGGAPLEEAELEKLQTEIEAVRPYMRPEGLETIDNGELFEIDDDGEYVTPLVKGAECAYVAFDQNGIAKCAIEQAHFDGKTDWRKPISCHLYPIRITQLKDFEALNYHRWPICKPACECGSKLNVPIFRFVKDSLIRKYGEDFYSKLEEAFVLWKSRQKA